MTKDWKRYWKRFLLVTDYTVLDDHLQEDKDGSLLQRDHAQVVCELTFINQI